MNGKIPCNLCRNNSNDVERIGIFRDFTFNVDGEFPLVRCKNCGLMYYEERPSITELTKYYPQKYCPYRKPIQDEKSRLIRWARRNNLKKKYALIKRFFPHGNGTILDVGCSTGIFLDLMRSYGWNTVGIDINSEAVQFASNRFGIDTRVGQLENFDFPEESFDIVSFWDVLEHTYDPKNNLAIAFKILTKNGLVVISIPQWESLDRILFGFNWIGYDAPRHMYIFTKKTIAELLKQAGFEIVYIRSKFGGYFTFLASLKIWIKNEKNNSKIWETIYRFLGIPGIRYLFQPIFLFLEFINFGGTLVIVAKKGAQ